MVYRKNNRLSILNHLDSDFHNDHLQVVILIYLHYLPFYPLYTY